MNFYLEKSQPLTVEEMIGAAGERGWMETYLRKMLRSLKAKGVVECSTACVSC